MRAERVIVLAFALPYLDAIGLFELTYERFVLPLVPFFAVFVAVGLAALVRRVSPRVRVVIVSIAGGALVLPAFAGARLAWLRSRPDTLEEAARWIENHAPAERVYVSASQPLDLPLFRKPEGFKPFGAKQLTPWTRWQVSVPESSAPRDRHDVRWLVAPPRGSDLPTHVQSLSPALFVIEAYEKRTQHRALVELRRALKQTGERLARFSPDRDVEASELDLFFQLSDHFNEGANNVDWPNFTARLLTARAIGPVIEICRVPAARRER